MRGKPLTVQGFLEKARRLLGHLRASGMPPDDRLWALSEVGEEFGLAYDEAYDEKVAAAAAKRDARRAARREH